METLPHSQTYDKPHCWQYDIRLQNLESDLKEAGFTKEQVKALKVRDFKFYHAPKEGKMLWRQIRKFIKRHEYLGTIPQRVTYGFIATYKGNIAGVVLFSCPYSFSKLLGPDTYKLEQNLSRGATISWSPKNLGSALNMFAIRWLVKNTPYRLISAYADPSAKERGIVLSACNFKFIGRAGTRIEVLNENNRFVSDRHFRKVGFYKRIAKRMGTTWQPNWSTKCKMHWENMPEVTKKVLKFASKDFIEKAQKRVCPPKKKFILIRGKDRREQRYLEGLLKKYSPNLVQQDGTIGLKIKSKESL